MAQPTTLTAANDLRGERENLSAVIYNLYPTEAVKQTNFGLVMSESRFIEWQTDKLRDPINDAHVEGDQFSGYVRQIVPTERYGTYHQISGTGYNISRTAIVVDKAGRADEMAYQVVKGLRETRNNVEKAAGQRKIAVAGDDTTAPQTAGAPAWIRSRFFGGRGAAAPTTNGMNGGYVNGAGTPGAAHGLRESHFLKAMVDTYDNANEMPNLFELPPILKQSFSNFLYATGSNRIATQYQDQGKDPSMGTTVIGAVDLYITDFGKVAIVPNRFVPKGTGADQAADATASCEPMLLNPEYWEFSHLSPFHVKDMGADGDSERRIVLVEWALCCKNEVSSAVITGINVNTAVAA